MGHPLVIAHRGVPREYRENTLPSFRRALEAGADGIELDVHGTLDGTLVVHHDASASQSATAGSASAEPVPIAARTLAQLRAAGLDEEALPTLADVIAEVNGRATLFVEVKGTGVESLVAQATREHATWCAVHSFDHRIVRDVLALAPALRGGALMTSYAIDPVRLLADIPARDLWQHRDFIDRALIDRVHDAGGRVIAWTVNDVTMADRLADWGIDGICTDLAPMFVARWKTRQ